MVRVLRRLLKRPLARKLKHTGTSQFYSEGGGYVRITPPFTPGPGYVEVMTDRLGAGLEWELCLTNELVTVFHIRDNKSGCTKSFENRVREFTEDLVKELDNMSDLGKEDFAD